ncbi:3-dehydroquinate synthase [Flavobacterium silvaticum]|uniref:3-dehydroquinate synthase n=1 Tax=Flavobacterium silvaticum TaxID=1852020 RepID=A0A972JGI3_9FLAO|nr:3-dehydroquinate synthase [Flavobacterium silvaticum]NMH29069.1 3-dehydroquinate synthase [Flavobacterium silvaticum]
MQSIQANGYSIFFNDSGYGELNSLLDDRSFSKIFILTDTNTHEFCLAHFLANVATETPIEVIEIEPGEQMKTIESCVELWTTLTELGADRKSLLINLGGGVVTDMGGFVAATYKRGIPFIHVPTTLLGMVDASVGGKNGVDLGSLKNQVGVITPPLMLIIDTDFLHTLPPRQMRSGLAEMLKHGLIADATYWNAFSDMDTVDSVELDALIHRSIEIKNTIVLQDPTENGIRKALNFGHTLGHAIESLYLSDVNKPELLHGEAIAAGMVLEAHISLQLDLLSEQAYTQIKNRIFSMYDKLVLADEELGSILELLQHDKKNEFGKILFVLLHGIGNIRIDQTVSNELIFKSFEDYHS